MKAKCSAVIALMTALLGLPVAGLGADASWFSEDYSSLDAASWTDAVGTWTRGAGDSSSLDEVNRIVNVSTEDALEFSPTVEAVSGRVTVVEAEAAFEPLEQDDDFPSADGRQAFLVLKEVVPDKECAFFGLTRAGFVRLSAAGLKPEPGRFYSLRFLLDYRVVPTTVRYVVDGCVLADAVGNRRFAAFGNARRVTAVGVTGDGRLGVFRGEQQGADRATVAPARVRPRVGNPIACTVMTNEETSLTGTLRYRWRVTGWDGTGTDEEVATAADYVPTEADYGHWISCEVSDDHGPVGEGRLWFSRLPVAYIDVKDGAWPSAAKEEHNARMQLLGNDRYKDQYDAGVVIKVRGNSTSNLPKKPYKLKLEKKTDLLSLGGKNKHWVLLANYYDESLMRNKLAYDFSSNFGLTYMKSDWVDVIFNGQYNGNYQLCQHIRIGEDRVDVFNWEDEVEDRGGSAKDLSLVDAASEDVSGGYLFEMSLEYDELSKFVVTSRTLRVATMVNSPEYLYTNPGMMAAAHGIWQDFWDACTSPNGYNSAGRHFSELADVDSLVGFFLTVEIFKNGDARAKSRYAYKDRGEPIRFGPVWDFDWGFGSPIIRQGCGGDPDATGWCCAKVDDYDPIGGDPSLICRGGFYKEWLDDPWFCRKVYDAYWRVRPEMEKLVVDGGTVDTYADYLTESGVANEGKWFFYTGFSGENGDAKWVKTFLKRRFAWLDEQFASVETFMASVKTSVSAAPYERSDDPSAGFPVSVAGNLGAVSNVTVAAGGDVPMTVSAKVAVGVNVYVNGLFVGWVSADAGVLRIPSSAFSVLQGQVDVVALDAVDAEDVILSRNYAFVTAERTTSGEVPVEFDWICRHYPPVTNNAWGAALPSDYTALATALDEHGLSPLGKCVPFAYDYLTGTDPARKDHFFRATIKVSSDGSVEVSPDPNLGDSRVYTLLGKETLDDGDDWKVADEASRFFKLKVDLPQ